MVAGARLHKPELAVENAYASEVSWLMTYFRVLIRLSSLLDDHGASAAKPCDLNTLPERPEAACVSHGREIGYAVKHESFHVPEQHICLLDVG